MHQHAHDHDHDHDHHGHDHGPPPVEPAFDAANQSLADALRRSFRVLKGLMLVLLVAYVLSGWTRVEEGQVGFIVRLGQVVGGTADRILKPGWHWAFPYPIDQVISVATQQERTCEGSFLFNITDEDKLRGVRRVVFSPLSPLRDNYLLTADFNIVHARLLCRYRVSDPVSYVTFVHDPAPHDDQPAELPVLSSLLYDAAISVAVRTPLSEIIGGGKQAFLDRIADTLRARLDTLAARGQPIGCEVIGVIAPQIADVEGIMVPRQVINEFDQVLAAEQRKIRRISTAQGDASEQLRRTGGGEYAALAEAIESEFDALLALLAAERESSADVEKFRAAHAERRAAVDKLLHAASGDVQQTINEAISERDRIVSEAEADVLQVRQLEPEYRRNGRFLVDRLRTELLQQVLGNNEIVKIYVPESALEYRLEIPRTVDDLRTDEEKKADELRTGAKRSAQEGFIDRTPLRTKPERAPE